MDCCYVELAVTSLSVVMATSGIVLLGKINRIVLNVHLLTKRLIYAQHYDKWLSPIALSTADSLHERNRSSHVGLIEIGAAVEPVPGFGDKTIYCSEARRNESNTVHPQHVNIMLNVLQREYKITEQLQVPTSRYSRSFTAAFFTNTSRVYARFRNPSLLQPQQSTAPTATVHYVPIAEYRDRQTKR